MHPILVLRPVSGEHAIASIGHGWQLSWRNTSQSVMSAWRTAVNRVKSQSSNTSLPVFGKTLAQSGCWPLRPGQAHSSGHIRLLQQLHRGCACCLSDLKVRHKGAQSDLRKVWHTRCSRNWQWNSVLLSRVFCLCANLGFWSRDVVTQVPTV